MDRGLICLLEETKKEEKQAVEEGGVGDVVRTRSFSTLLEKGGASATTEKDTDDDYPSKKRTQGEPHEEPRIQSTHKRRVVGTAGITLNSHEKIRCPRHPESITSSEGPSKRKKIPSRNQYFMVQERGKRDRIEGGSKPFV